MLLLDEVVGLALLALWIFCLVDVITTREGECRNLPRLVWLLIVLIVPTVGAVVWLVAGRPRAEPAARMGFYAGAEPTGFRNTNGSAGPPVAATRTTPNSFASAGSGQKSSAVGTSSPSGTIRCETGPSRRRRRAVHPPRPLVRAVWRQRIAKHSNGFFRCPVSDATVAPIHPAPMPR